MITFLKWFASILGFIGAILITANIDETKYAFIVFTISSTIWIYVAIIMKEYSIIFLNLGYLILNIIGIYRWFQI